MEKFHLINSEILIILLKSIGSLVIFSAGLGMCVFTYTITRLMIEGSHWVTAPATITYTYSIQAHESLKTGNTKVEYRPNPEYTFLAKDGKIYKGSLYSIGIETVRDTEVTKDMLEHPMVVIGQIYYNPNNPNESAVIQPTFDFYLILLFVIVSIGLLGGGTALFLDIFSWIRNFRSGL